ncbi:MAG: hypothetical protein ACHQF0_07995 [Chitinophagales bacterium]
MKKIVLKVVFVTLFIAFFLPGCVEHRYYRQNHRHSESYEHHHHRSPHTGVDIDIHN